MKNRLPVIISNSKQDEKIKELLFSTHEDTSVKDSLLTLEEAFKNGEFSVNNEDEVNKK